MEGLMLNEQGYVAECTGDNVFIVKDGAILTPRIADGALDGITRGVIFELAADLGIPMSDATLTRYDLYTSDECFLTGTAAEVIPVVAIDQRPIGDGTVGETVQKLLAAFRELTQSSGTPIEGP